MDEGGAPHIHQGVGDVRQGVEEDSFPHKDEDSRADQNTCTEIFPEVNESEAERRCEHIRRWEGLRNGGEEGQWQC
jgi:hypothetical protein